MKIINNPQVNQVLKNYQKHVSPTEKTEPAAMARDKIEISEEARDFQTAMKAFKELPDVRQSKIDTVKSQVESGQYKPSAEAVVDKIMQMIKGK